MENQFLVDSEYLSPEALAVKHRLETDPSSRKDHMEYLPGMEIIESDVCSKVMTQMKQYEADRYTAKDVRAALEHETCTIEDFKALISPAAEPFWSRWRSAHEGKRVNISVTRCIFLHRCILPIIVKITACIVALIAIITSTA